MFPSMWGAALTEVERISSDRGEKAGKRLVMTPALKAIDRVMPGSISGRCLVCPIATARDISFGSERL